MKLPDFLARNPQLLLEASADRYAHLPAEPALAVGFVPGVMPDKWFKRWRERYQVLAPLADLPLGEGQGLAGLEAGLDMVLLRPDWEPAARDKQTYHLVSLYREEAVLLLPKEHLLTLLETVPLTELAEEKLIQSADSLEAWGPEAQILLPLARELEGLEDVSQQVEMVAAGLGLLVLPLSLARFYHRKDLTYRPLEGLGQQEVALVWLRQEWSQEQEAIVQDFVGICRGRKASSHRSQQEVQTSPKPRKKSPTQGKSGRGQKAQKPANRRGRPQFKGRR